MASIALTGAHRVEVSHWASAFRQSGHAVRICPYEVLPYTDADSEVLIVVFAPSSPEAHTLLRAIASGLGGVSITIVLGAQGSGPWRPDIGAWSVSALASASDAAPPEARPGPAGPEYAACRWAHAVAKLKDRPYDARTIPAWGRSIGASAGAIRSWCRTARVPPKSSLTLARLVRAVWFCRAGIFRPEAHLDVTDTRTVAKMLAAGGISDITTNITIEALLRNQTLVANPAAVSALAEALGLRYTKGDDGKTYSSLCSERG